MATVNFTRQSPAPHNVHVITWANFTESDTCIDYVAPGAADKTFTVVANYGTLGHVTVEGSNDGVNYFPFTDPQGNAIDKTANSMEVLEENPLFLRPRVTAGTGVTATVVLCARSNV